MAVNAVTPSVGARVPALAGLGVLLAVSGFVRTRALDTPYWIDEGISVGIASHSLFDIPGLLEQDGSPPLYYLLLGAWIRAFGSGEAATHTLSLAAALAAVPLAWWAGRSLFGPAAGWIAAFIAALTPWLTVYAQETRMYALVMPLSVLATAAFVHGFVRRDRRFVAVFAVALAALLYTHNWGLFFAAGTVVALALLLWGAADRRSLLRHGLYAFGGAGLLYAPWVPTLVSQVRHTGAPWAETPSLARLAGWLFAPSSVEAAAGTGAMLILGAVGLAFLLRDPERMRRASVHVLVVLLLVPPAAAWLVSQVEPSWSNRYLAVIAGPIVLLSGAGLARLRGVGALAVVALVALWLPFRAPELKSDLHLHAVEHGPSLTAGDLVLVAQPELVPALSYYLGRDLDYVTPLGRVANPAVMDWRNATERLTAAPDGPGLGGGRVLFVAPAPGALRPETPWGRLVLARSGEWRRALVDDAGLEAVDSRPPQPGVRLAVATTLFREKMTKK